MSAYPERGRTTKADYLDQWKDSEFWALACDLQSGERILFRPPGLAGTVAVPMLSLLAYVFLSISFASLFFRDATMPVRAGIIFGGPFIPLVIQAVIIGRLSLGFMFAQQDLVRFQTALLIAVAALFFLNIAENTSQLSHVFDLLAVAAAYLAKRLSTGIGVTSYATLIRLKRLKYEGMGNGS
ncbi:hypothetical protein [Mangrovitalea sediminis]|uniref:hypothetical protein n=1 Tax=Mangrovitalea sediminis TaxID=1982043 RepID=UPI000BE5372A|nr:hypothetical protein [Mangrovitalea sediminis]